MKNVVQVVPVGEVARSFVKELTEPLGPALGLEVVLGAPLGHPKYAFNKDRNQFHSTAILRRLASQRAQEQLAVLGVAQVDLFVPDSGFVLGEADREGRVAIVSLARLRPEFYGHPPDNDLLRARGRVELAHEVGHLLGLSHCDDPKCAMFFSITVADSDRKCATPCQDCLAELGRALAHG